MLESKTELSLQSSLHPHNTCDVSLLSQLILRRLQVDGDLAAKLIPPSLPLAHFVYQQLTVCSIDLL